MELGTIVLSSHRAQAVPSPVLYVPASQNSQDVLASFGARPELTSVAADPQCQRCLEENQLAWRQIVAQV